MISGIIFFGLVLYVGWRIIFILKEEEIFFLERLALAYFIGLGVATFTWFLLGLTGVYVNLLILNGIFLCYALVLWGINWPKRARLEIKIHLPKARPISIVLASILLAILLTSLIINLWWPIYMRDAVASWATKAKALAVSGDLESIKVGSSTQHPLHVPISVALFEYISPSLRKLFVSLNFFGLVLIFFFNLKRFLSKNSSLFFTILLITIPYLFEHSLRVYADLTCSFYYISGTLYLYLFFKTNDRGWLLISGFLSGICIWTKAEACLMVAINTLVLFIWLVKHKQIKLFISFISFPLIFGLSWWLYTNIFLGVENSHLHNSQNSILKFSWIKLSFITQYMWHKLNVIPYWGITLPILLLSMLLRYKYVKKAGFFLIIIASNIIILCIEYYFYQAGTLRTFMHSTIQREYLHFFPLLIFSMALINGEIIDTMFRFIGTDYSET